MVNNYFDVVWAWLFERQVLMAAVQRCSYVFDQKWIVNERTLWNMNEHWLNTTSSPNFLQNKVCIFISLEVFAWVMTACWVLSSRLTFFWRNINISVIFLSFFYFFRSRLHCTQGLQYSSLLDTLKMMLFTKYLKSENTCDTQNQQKKMQ